MSDTTLLIILSIPMVLALGFGVWAGLGYPGLYDRYESTGRVSRDLPVRQMLARLPRRSDRDEESDSRREEEGDEEGPRRRVRLERKAHWRGPGRR